MIAAIHRVNGEKVSSCCGIKTKPVENKKYCIIKVEQVSLARKFLNPDFHVADDYFLVRMCVTCSIYLDKKNKRMAVNLPVMPNLLSNIKKNIDIAISSFRYLMC